MPWITKIEAIKSAVVREYGIPIRGCAGAAGVEMRWRRFTLMRKLTNRTLSEIVKEFDIRVAWAG